MKIDAVANAWKSALPWVQRRVAALFLLGQELSRADRTSLQFQRLLVFPLSHPGKGTDKAGPRLCAMFALLSVWECRCPHCSATGSQPGTSQGWSLIPPSCLCKCVHWVLLEKLRRRGYANRSCLKEQVSRRDGGKDIPSPHIPKLSRLSQASSQCSMFQDQV